MKDFIKNRKWIKVVLIIEIAVLLFVVITSFGKRHEYMVDLNSFYSESDNVSITADGNMFISAAESDDNYDYYEDEVLFYSDVIDISGGVYDVNVYYETGMPEQSEIDVVGGYFFCVSAGSFPSSIEASSNNIIYGQKVSNGRYWIKSTFVKPSIQLQYITNNMYDVTISKITIEENLIGRVWRILSCIIIILLIDVLVFLFAGDYYSAKQKQVGLLILLFTAGASLLSFTDVFYLYGDDMDFHLGRIVSIANELSYGQFPVRMQSDILNGYGYASSLFYADFFLYIPAILYNLTVPLSRCLQIYIILTNFATAWIAYAVFKKMFNSYKAGITGSFIYTFSAYRLYDIYTRCAVGEFTAMAFYPLIILGIYNIHKSKDKLKLKEYLPLIIGMSGVIESHILSCYMICIALVLYILLNIRQFLVKDKMLAILKSILLTLALNAFFIIPFIDSYRMDLVVKNVVYEIQQRGLSFAAMFNLFFGRDYYSVQDMMISAGFILLAGIVIYILLYIKRDEYKLKEYREFHYGNKLVILSIVFILLASKYFPYEKLEYCNDILKKLICVIQFPWRWLGILTVILCLVFLCAVSLLNKTENRTYVKYIIMFSIILTVISTYSYYYNDVIFADEKYEAYYESDIYGQMLIIGSGGEYLLGDSMESGNIAYRVSSPDSDSEDVSVLDWTKDGNKRYLTVSNTGDYALVNIPVFAYDNYEAYDENYNFNIYNTGDYRISILIPAGYSGTITISYEKPFLWVIAEVISCITIIMLIFNKTIFKKKQEQVPEIKE